MALVTVVFPVVVDTDLHGINIDKHRLNNEDGYKFELAEEILDAASKILNTSSIEGVVHQCDEIPELVG